MYSCVWRHHRNVAITHFKFFFTLFSFFSMFLHIILFTVVSFVVVVSIVLRFAIGWIFFSAFCNHHTKHSLWITYKSVFFFIFRLISSFLYINYAFIFISGTSEHNIHDVLFFFLFFSKPITDICQINFFCSHV